MRFGRNQSEALLDADQEDLVAETADGVVELVNELTPGRARGMPSPAPTGIDRVRATAEGLVSEAVTAAHAAQLADIANRFRVVFGVARKPAS